MDVEELVALVIGENASFITFGHWRLKLIVLEIT